MKKTLALLFSIIFAFSLLANDTLVFRETIYFESGKAELDNDELFKLNAFVKKLYFHGQIAIEIEGHTDNVGSLEKNLKLSEERAKNVEDCLKMLGFDFRVEAEKAMGQNAPKASNSSKEGQKLNRRVEVKAIVNKLKNVQDFFESVRTRQTQTFIVNCQEPQTIVGKNGIRLDIPANAFVDANGEPVVAGKVEIRLVEATKMSDMLLLGLTTMTSDGNALETGGMFRVEAFQNNQPLSLAPDKNIGFTIKTNKPLPNMNTYVASNSPSNSPEPSERNEKTTNTNQPKGDLTSNQGVIMWNPNPIGPIQSKKTEYVVLDSAYKSKLRKMYTGPEPKIEISCGCLDSIKFIPYPSEPNRPKIDTFKFRPKNAKEFLYSPRKKKDIVKKAFRKQLKVYNEKLNQYQKDTLVHHKTNITKNVEEGKKLKDCLKNFEDKVLEKYFEITDYKIKTLQPTYLDSTNQFIDNLLSSDSINIIDLICMQPNIKIQDKSYKDMLEKLYFEINKLIKRKNIKLLEIAHYESFLGPDQTLESESNIRASFIIPIFKDFQSYIRFRTSYISDTNFIYGIILINEFHTYPEKKCLDNCISPELLNSKLTYTREKSYISNEKIKLSENELEKIKDNLKNGLFTESNLTDYIGETNKLSWINCDRRIFINEQTEDLFVEESQESSIFITFRNYQALLRFEKFDGNHYLADKIPNNDTDALVTSFRIINGRPFMSKLSIKSFNKEPISLPQYVECDMEEIRAAFD